MSSAPLDTTLDREVAVKVLSRDQSADEETLRRFRNEAQSAARLNHDNIARVFYVGEDRGVHYIVFEFIEGVNLRDLVEHHGPLPLDQALSYTYQIALALDHASQRSVIHRDIKPSNVLVTPDGKAKLVDMGLARLNLMAQASNDLTASGVTLGTFDYISPEQARDPRSADVRSDLYSLGCSLFFMLTGRPPFPEGTVLQKLLQHQGDSPPDPRTFRPELPPSVTRVLSRLLAKNPADRYQEPAELIDELAVLGKSLGMQLGEQQPARPIPRPAGAGSRWQRHLPWLVPLAALFVIVLGLDVYWSNTLATTTDAGWNAPDNRLPAVEASPTTAPEVLIPEPSLREPRPPEAAAASSLPERLRSDSQADAVASPAGIVADDQTAKSLVEAMIRPFEKFAERYNAERAETQATPIPAGSLPADRINDELDLSGGARIRPRHCSRRRHRRPLRRTCSRSETTTCRATIAVCTPPRARPRTATRSSCATTGGAPNARSRSRTSSSRCGPAAGFRPIVAFAPDPEKPYTRPEMVSVAGGQLLASDIQWELDLPPNSPVVKSLFETRRADLLDFQRCTFTIRGQPLYHAGVAFFDIQAPPGSNSVGMGGTAMDGHVVTINLQNCVARGEATLLRDAELQSVRLTWDNGLLATSERLFAADGDALLPRQEAEAQLVLRSVTVMVGSGLALLTNTVEAPHQLFTDLRCYDCIIATTGSSPLVEQRFGGHR